MTGQVGRLKALFCVKVGPLVWWDSCSSPDTLPAELRAPSPLQGLPSMTGLHQNP